MVRLNFKDEINTQRSSERIETAKRLIERIVDHTREVIAVYEIHNAIVQNSPRISEQIMPSFAMQAFIATRNALHRFEFLRLTALWDKADFDTASIPSVVELIDDVTLLEELAEEVRHEVAGQPHAEEVREMLRSIITNVRVIMVSSELRSIRNIRHKHIAHALEKTWLEKDLEEKNEALQPVEYADEIRLLNDTIPIVQNLHLWVNGSDFDFVDASRIAKNRAEELWDNCHFSITKR